MEPVGESGRSTLGDIRLRERPLAVEADIISFLSLSSSCRFLAFFNSFIAVMRCSSFFSSCLLNTAKRNRADLRVCVPYTSIAPVEVYNPHFHHFSILLLCVPELVMDPHQACFAPVLGKGKMQSICCALDNNLTQEWEFTRFPPLYVASFHIHLSPAKKSYIYKSHLRIITGNNNTRLQSKDLIQEFGG